MQDISFGYYFYIRRGDGKKYKTLTVSHFYIKKKCLTLVTYGLTLIALSN